MSRNIHRGIQFEEGDEIEWAPRAVTQPNTIKPQMFQQTPKKQPPYQNHIIKEQSRQD